MLAKAMLLIALLALPGAVVRAGVDPDVPPVVPRPAIFEQRWPGTSFRVKPTTPILLGRGADEIRPLAESLAELLGRYVGGKLTVREVQPKEKFRGKIIVTLTGEDPKLGDQVYYLGARPDLFTIGGTNPSQVFYAIQTLRQILPPETLVDGVPSPLPGGLRIPSGRIVDYPRYRWRGMLLDCGRHFMPKELIKRYIDLLAFHKMNVLHWHLTEDQGWRIEIKKYPKLTEIGAWRKATREDEQPRKGDLYGGYYTQEDIREIVAYAQSRFVTVVPEIEMPGHCMAALASYPELSCTGGPFEVMTRWGISPDVYCAGNDETFEFLEGVLTEVMELFPSEYIHIGGDEVIKDRWKACPKCQARMRAEGLKNEEELQSWFIRRIEKFLNAHGRRLIGWDEILEGGLAPNATVQSWRGMEGAIAAARAGHDVIASPTSHCYLDYAQVRLPGEPTRMGFIDLRTAYSFEPTPPRLSDEEARHILGLEGNMWTEHAPPERVDYQVFPRLCALAEVAWSPPEARDWDDFQRRMKVHYRRLDALGVAYFIPPPECRPSERTFAEDVTVRLSNPFERGEIHYTLDGTEPGPASPRYTEPIRLTATTTIKARLVLGNGRTSNVATFEFVQQAEDGGGGAERPE